MSDDSHPLERQQPQFAASAFATQLRNLVTAPGIATAGINAGITLGIGVVSAALILTAIVTTSGVSLDAAIGFLSLLVGAGWMLGAGVSGFVQTSEFLGAQMQADSTVTALALGSLTAIVFPTALVTRVRSHADGSASGPTGVVVARTAVESGAIALSVTLVTAIPAVSLGPEGSSGIVRSNGVATFFITIIVAFVGMLLGRLRARASLGLHNLGGFGSALREAGMAGVVLFCVFGAIAVIGGLIYAFSEGQLPIAIGLLPFIGNAAAMLAGLAGLGGIVLSTSFTSASQTLLAGDLLGGWGWALLLVGLLTCVVLAVRIGAHRGPTASIRWNRVWQLPAVAFVMWLLLAFVLTMTINASSSIFGGSGSLGISWWTPFMGAVWAFLVSLGAEFAPGFALAVAPAAFGAIVGKRGVATWASTAAPVAATPAVPFAAAPPASPSAATGAAEYPSEANPTAPLKADAPSEATPPATVLGGAPIARPQLSPRAKRGAIIGVASVGGIGLLVAAAFITVGILNGSRGPETVVQAYVDALSKGDATRAAKIVDPGLPNDDRLLLTDEALSAADHRMTVESVTSTDIGETMASVEAVLAVDGERFTHTFTASRGENEFLVLNTWKLSDPMLVPVQVGADESELLQLGDIEIPLTTNSEQYLDSASDSVWVYPGTYTFNAPSSTYVESKPDTVRAIAPDAAYGSAQVWVEQVPSDALKEAILAQAQATVTACATVPTNIEEFCPSRVQSRDLEALSLTRQISTLEEVTLTSFRTDEAIITTQGKPIFGSAATPYENEFSLEGTIEFTDGEPVFEFELGW